MTSGDEFTHSEFSQTPSGIPLGLEAELAGIDEEVSEQAAIDAATRAAEDRIVTHLSELGFDVQCVTAIRTQYPDYTASELCGEAEQLGASLAQIIERFKSEGRLFAAAQVAEKLKLVLNTIANLAILSHLSVEMGMMECPEYCTGDEKAALQAKVFADETLTRKQQEAWFLVIDELIDGEGLDLTDPRSIIRIDQTAGELRDFSETSHLREKYIAIMRPILQGIFVQFNVAPHDQLESMSTALFSAALREQLGSLQKDDLVAAELEILRKRATLLGWNEERLQQIRSAFLVAVHDAGVFDNSR